MRIEEELKLDYADVLFRPKRSTSGSRKEIDLTRTFNFKHSPLTFTGIPIMAANMDNIGTFSVANVLQQDSMVTCLHKHYTVGELAEAYTTVLDNSLTFISTGISDDETSKLSLIMNSIPKNCQPRGICVDVANGYTVHFVNKIKQIRSMFPDKIIIAGNVVTADMTSELILAGADIIKVGIGPGSACLTRKKTGVGYPQLSAVIECADAAHGLGGHIIADGGCTCPGDVAKAFGGGADFVMLGGMFAGHDETGTEFYGMSSKTAQEKHNGGLSSYRASEGRTIKLESKGPLIDTVNDILGGIRSTCTYVGATKLKDLSKCTTFVRVNSQINNVFDNKTTGS